MAGHEHVRLDDEDPQKREEASITEIGVLRDRVRETDAFADEMANIINMMHGVQEIGAIKPEEVRKLYTAVDSAIEAFLRPMDQALRQNKPERDRLIASLRSSDSSLPAFRTALRGDAELKQAALDPYTNTIDIWTAYIWRLLNAMVFRKQAVGSFYALDENATGPNASEHMTHLDEIEDLMKQADPPVFGEYVRRLWRRQALAAIFRTANFSWVDARRKASINKVGDQIWSGFSGFSRLINPVEGRRLVVEIVFAAVRLSEHMMIEADDIWFIQNTGFTGGNASDFYTRIKQFDLKPVGTINALRDNAPLDTISDRFNSQHLRDRIKPLCTIAPALRYRHFEMKEEDYKNPLDLIKPRILVSLRQAAPAGGRQAAAAAPQDEQIFYTLAQIMGLGS